MSTLSPKKVITPLLVAFCMLTVTACGNSSERTQPKTCQEAAQFIVDTYKQSGTSTKGDNSQPKKHEKQVRDIEALTKDGIKLCGSQEKFQTALEKELPKLTGGGAGKGQSPSSK